ncbi:hypothetical protein BDW75DRAFT_166141 [Aspergillus navahoensis]
MWWDPVPTWSSHHHTKSESSTCRTSLSSKQHRPDSSPENWSAWKTIRLKLKLVINIPNGAMSRIHSPYYCYCSMSATSPSFLVLLMAMGSSQSRPRRSDDPLEPCPNSYQLQFSFSGCPSRGNFRQAGWPSPNHARSSVPYPSGSGVVSYMLTLTPPTYPQDETLEERLNSYPILVRAWRDAAHRAALRKQSTECVKIM